MITQPDLKFIGTPLQCLEYINNIKNTFYFIILLIEIIFNSNVVEL